MEKEEAPKRMGNRLPRHNEETEQTGVQMGMGADGNMDAYENGDPHKTMMQEEV
jgi:hypothetical protein